jgi:hypothetical protein
VRDDERGPLDALVPVEEEVEVERPGPVPPDAPVAALRGLDGEEEGEELLRPEEGAADGDGVQEVGLGRPADRLGPVEGRDDEALDPPGEAIEGP